jgi:hypothetical protein
MALRYARIKKAMVSREDLRRFLDGYRAASARQRQETLRRLRTLSVDEARTEYDALCRGWEASPGSAETRSLDPLIIRERVALRRRLAGRR